MKEWNTEWQKGHAFAEVAEALKVKTSQIIGATTLSGVELVLYTPSPDGKGEIWSAFMKRDEDDVLQVAKTMIMGTTDELEADIARRLKDAGLE